jgi:iron complex transport system ATP-binding protein
MELKIDGLGFSYPSKKVLDNITAEYDGPQLVAILGPNGVGKSTLIHCIDRILKPNAGHVFIDGKDSYEYHMKEMAQKVGYVPYASSDVFPMSVVDAVLLGRHPHSNWKSTREDVKLVFSMLKRLGIDDLADCKFNELSAGQHQKVMLARGLVQQPEIILLDEPTANLDVKHQLGVTKLLRDISHDDGVLVIMICHDLNIASKYADSILMMKDGTIYAAGTPEEVLIEENIREVYDVECRVIEDEGRPHVILREGTL